MAHNAFLRLESEGHWGLGEGVPSARVTGTSLEDVVAFLSQRARGLGPAKLEDAKELASEVARTVLEAVVEPGPGPAALDIALLDLAGRAGGVTARELLDLPVAASLPTSITVSLGPVDEMVAEAEEHWRSGFEVLKVKLGRDMISSRRFLASIKDAVPNAVIRVDANEAWNLRIAKTMLPLMDRYEVELVEQPLPRGEHEAMAEVTRTSPVPIVADEMVLGTGDVETIGRDRLAHGINIKLQKVGGLSVGARLALRAKELDLKVMVGCFIESGVGIAAASQLLGLCDWADLDGHLLLDVNPIPGPPIEMGNVSMPPEAGIGHGGSELAVEALVGLEGP
jgi:L-alanine-DL-glutamate epimerase-like enolase superfamily enzyme